MNVTSKLSAISFRVVNITIGEVRAEIEQLKDAIELCDALATANADCTWAVVVQATIYERTPSDGG